MASAGGLFVEIIPTFAGGIERIYAELVAPAGEAGATAAKEMGAAFTRQSAEAGAEAGRTIALEITTSVREGATAAGTELRSGITKGATEAGAAAGTAIKDGVTKGAAEGGAAASTVLKDASTKAGAEAGTSAGSWFSKTFGAESTKAGASLVAGLRAQVDAVAVSVTRAEADMAAARAASDKATGAVALAEANLLATRVKYQVTNPAVTKSETELAAAQANEAKAVDAVTLAQTRLNEVQAKYALDSSQVLSATNSLKSARADLETASGRTTVAEQRLGETRARYQGDTPQIIQAENKLSAARNSADLASGKVTTAESNLTRAHSESSKAVSELESAQKKTVFSSDNLGAAFNRLVPGAKALGDQTKQLGLLVGVTLAGSMAVNGVKSAGDLQQALTRLVTSAGESERNLKGVGDGLLQMSGQVGFGTKELASGMYTVESAGYHGAEGLKVMKAAAEGAKAENSDLSTSANAVTTILQDYHLKADQAALMTTKLVAAVSDGKTNFQDFTGALHAVTPLAAAAGISFDDVGGALASMTSHGMSAEQAAQNLAMAIRTFQNPSMQMRQELGNLGLSAEDLSQKMGQRGITGTMEMVSQQILQRMGPDGKILMDAFNQSRDAARGLTEMMAHMSPEAAKVAQAFNEGTINLSGVRKAIGKLEPEQANLVKQYTTLHNRAEGFSNQLKKGGSDVQTYASELQKVTGNSVTANVMLQTTGENAEYTAKAIRDIAGATTEAGNHVKGWHDIQGTFNQKLSEFKANSGALGITLGTALLPILQIVMGALGGFMKFLSQYPVIASGAAIAVGGLVAAFVGMFVVVKIVETVKAFTTVLKTWEIGTKLASAAQWLWNAALSANPIGLIIVGIAALVAGVVYAYIHFETFRHVVNAVFDGLMTGVKAVGGFFVMLWHGAEAAWHGVAVGAAWLWGILKPIFDGISLALRIAAAVLLTLFITPTVIALHYLGEGFKWLWDNALNPFFHKFFEGCDWLGAKVREFLGWLHDRWLDFVLALKLVWDATGQKLVDKVVEGFQWLNDKLTQILAWLGKLWHEMCVGLKWDYDNIVKPVIDFFADKAHWLNENVIKPITDGISYAWHKMGEGLQWVHDNIIQPVMDKASEAVHKVGGAFDSAVNWMHETWDRVKQITREPVNFIIDVVYNHGIVPTWNHIAGIFGLGQLQPVPMMASGGSLGGGGMWDAVGGGFRTDGPRAIVGEGNQAYPEYVIPTDPAHRDRAMGLYSALGADIGLFAQGGVLGGIGTFVGGIGRGIGGLATDAWHGIEDAFGWITSIAGDIAGGVGRLFRPITDSLGGLPLPFGAQGGSFKDALTHIPGKVIDSVIDLVKKLFASGAGPIAGGGAPPGMINDWIMQALGILGWPLNYAGGLFQQIMTESGGRPGIVQQIHDVNSGGNEARGIMQVIPPTFATYAMPGHGNIFNPVDNIIAGARYAMNRYGSAWFNPGPQHSHGYDNGGYLQPGHTSVYNGTGQPEPVFTSAQWEVLKANLDKSGATGSGGNTINVYASSERSGASIAHEVDRHLSRPNRLSFNM